MLPGYQSHTTSVVPLLICVPPTPTAYGADAGQPADMILLPVPSRQPSVPVSPEAKNQVCPSALACASIAFITGI